MRSPSVTHKIMSSIKSKNTKPEMLLRHTLWRHGFRYRVNVKDLPGKPDIVFTRARIAIFCDGDFWHGHNWAIRGLASLEDELNGYSDYWQNKIRGNIERDQKNTQRLQETGWEVIRLWESDIRANTDACIELIESAYTRRIRQ